MGVSDVDVAPIFGGGAGGTAASSSENCESGCQLSIPWRQPRSVGAKRPVRSPSRTSSSENAPKLVAPRLTWIIANNACVLVSRESKVNARWRRLNGYKSYKGDRFNVVDP